MRQVTENAEVLIHGAYFCGLGVLTVLSSSYNSDQCCLNYKEACDVYTNHDFFCSDFLKML